MTTSPVKVHGAQQIFVSAGVKLDRVELTSVKLDQSYNYSGASDENGYNGYNNGFTTPYDFVVTVDWGDGTPPTGAEWEQDYSNWGYGNSLTPYRLLGTHTYQSPGDYQVRVNIVAADNRLSTSAKLREDGNYAYSQHRGSSVTQAKVFLQTLTAQPLPITAVDDQQWSGVVATFQDSAQGTSANDYVATINWGEANYGFQYFSQGVIVSLGDGSFAVRGEFTYLTEADPTVTVSINRINGPSIVTQTDANVRGAKPIFGSAGVVLGNVELSSLILDSSAYGYSFDESGGYIYNPGNVGPSNFTVTVDWGDGTPLTDALWDQDYTSGWGYGVAYRLLGSHTYAGRVTTWLA